MAYVDVDKAVGIGYLSDWYQSSIDDTKPPIWTDEHIEELTNDFIVIPKDASTADVAKVKHGEWRLHPDGSGTCNQCGRTQKGVWDFDNAQKYCGCCGAKMDGGKEE